MKPTLLFIVAVTSALPLVRAANQPGSAAPSRIEIIYTEPDKFTDVRDSYSGSDRGREAVLDQVREYFTNEAKRYVPEGYKVSVTIADIDLAGDFEPWRGANWDDVRVVKDIYPPRISLTFRLLDPSGQIVKEGKRDLKDLAFMMKITPTFRDDPLRHEKALITDWLRDEFRDIRKS